MVHKQLSQLLKGCKTYSQARLAEDAEVNRGQLNNWLSKGNNLGEDKVVAVVEALLTWLDTDDGKACKARHASLIEQIKSFPAYQAALSNAFPLQPVPAGHPTYVERDTDSRLAAQIERPPADMVVVGGIKMGKTSLQNRLQRNLHHRHNVLRVDFRGQTGDPLAVITQAARVAGFSDTRLRDWAGFPDWVRRTLLVNAKPCTLIFDHVQELPADHLCALQDGLHHLVNQRRQEPILDQLNLVLAYDEAAPAMRHTRDSSSGMTRELKSLVLTRFDESQVERLLGTIVQIHDPAELAPLVSAAWTHFRGHPFLTHLWADALAGQTGRCNPDQALQDITAKADQFLFQPFLDNLDTATRSAIQAATTPTANGIEARSVSECASTNWREVIGVSPIRERNSESS